MDSPHIERLLVFMLVVNATSVHSLVLHQSNKNSRESLRLIRSSPSTGSLDQTHASSLSNCYGPSCVSNEQLCNETRQGCEMCRYGHDECTANWDCFQFCSEQKAKEICGGQEGSTETTGSPWWSYFILGIFVISVAINICFVIISLRYRKRNTPKPKRQSNKPQENNPQIINQIQQTLPKKPSAPPENLIPLIHDTDQNFDNNESEKDQTFDPLDSAPSDKQHIEKRKQKIGTDTLEIGATVPIKEDKH